MNIFFDVDYTILGGHDLTLRPGTHEVFTRLRDDGHDVFVWSGEGERWSVVRNHGLEHLVNGVYGKPLHDYKARLGAFGVPVMPDFVIDDYPGIVRCFGGMCISEYLGSPSRSRDGSIGEEDTEFEVVYDLIKVMAAGGVPEHPRYYAAEG